MASLDPKTRRGERLQAVLTVLKDHPDGMRARDVLAEVERRVAPLTDYEAGAFEKTGLGRFEKLTRFGTVNAVKSGWLIKDKGIWTVLPDGIAALAQYPDPGAFYSAAEAGYSEWAKQQPPKAPDDSPEDEEAATELAVSFTVEEAQETAFDEIATHLHTMNPYDTQRLVAGLLRGMGYHVPWVSPPGKDKGVDVIAFRDPLGTEGPRIKVQVKREQSKTDVHGLRAFMSLLNTGDVGVFVTLGGFTSDAEAEARNSETRRVTLIDRSGLLDLWIEHYDRIPSDDRLLLPLRPVHFLDTGTLDAEPD